MPKSPVTNPLSRKDLKEELSFATKEIMKHMTLSFGHERNWATEEFDKVKKRFDTVQEEFDKVHAELEAIKEILVYRQELRNLVRELKARDNTLDESKIFAT